MHTQLYQLATGIFKNYTYRPLKQLNNNLIDLSSCPTFPQSDIRARQCGPSRLMCNLPLLCPSAPCLMRYSDSVTLCLEPFDFAPGLPAACPLRLAWGFFGDQHSTLSTPLWRVRVTQEFLTYTQTHAPTHTERHTHAHARICAHTHSLTL